MPPELSEGWDRERLLNFLVDHYDDEMQLSRSLRRLGATFDPGRRIWASKASTYDNFRELLERATSEDWLPLLAFCTIAERISSPAAEPLASSIFSQHLQAGLFLYCNVLVEASKELEEATFPVCFRAARQGLKGPWEPTTPPGANAESPLYAACWLACAEEAARDRGPFLCFARALHPRLSEVGRQRLDAWWKQSAARLGLDGTLAGDSPGRDAVGGECYSVLVELRETTDSTPQNPRWMRRAWIHRHGTARSDPLDRESPGRTETQETIPNYLVSLLNELGRRRIPQDRAVFEFFVSRPSLACAIDQWKVPVEPEIPSEIGYELPVIIRDLDRKPATLALVELRWSRLKAAQALDGGAIRESRRATDPLETYQEFDREKGLLCLVLSEPVAARKDVDEFKSLIIAASRAGLPVIIWARCDKAVAALRKEAVEWFKQPPRDLPCLVHNLRHDCKSGDPEHLSHHLTLFFENADHWLPPEDRLMEAQS